MNMMPEEKRRKHKQYIPAELIEQILLKLAMKSLFRFTTVSKSWNSMILGREFARRYRGRVMMVMEREVFPLSDMFSASERSRPFRRRPLFKCDASCGELWCVEFESCLILHNPTTQKYRKLPIPSARVPIGSTTTVAVEGSSSSTSSVFVYGLGYDSIGDDYKILKIHRSLDVETELYSLKTDSWTKVKSPPKYNWEFSYGKCVFASGALHWPIKWCIRNNNNNNNNNNNGEEEGLEIEGAPAVLSFDLNTHKFRVLKPIKRKFVFPLFLPCRMVEMDMGVCFGGKLRVSLDVGSGMFSTLVKERKVS